MTIRNNMLIGTALSGIIMSLATSASAQSTPSMSEMWKMLQAQQAKIDNLETELAQAQVETIEVKKSVNSVADAIETIPSGGLGGRTQIGGYGELHYEGGAKDQIDIHRFVLFFGHDFTDNIRFFSELEVEHAIAGEGKVGEVELEQMYLEMDIGESTQIYGGVHLVPVGIINETHEPTTFFGVERNAVEKNIIPATWWEGGIGLHGNVGSTGFSYDAMVSSGLDLNTGNGYKIRSGRQKVGKAKFNSQAYTGRVQYTGLPGVTLASSMYYQPDVTQSAGDSISGQDVSAFLWESHIQAKFNGFGLNALYANWSLDGADVDASGRDKQNGFYIEPSYTFDMSLGYLEGAKLGVFYRYSDWDNNNGIANNSGTHRSVFGVNFWPIDEVVLKMDYIIEDKESGGPSKNSMNLGIGYQF
ncbi:MAG: hypothetical protein JKX72_10005 [Robiginitomaculum sp.]|nr:hypothetical protein [Robiginitomaculum sp.]